MMVAVATVVAAHKTSVIIGSATAWVLANIVVIGQVEALDGVPQFVVYGVGVTGPVSFGWFLWRQFLKAQNETEAYLQTQVVSLRSESQEAHKLASQLRNELAMARVEAMAERTNVSMLNIELSKANQALKALNPDLATRVTEIEDNQGD